MNKFERIFYPVLAVILVALVGFMAFAPGAAAPPPDLSPVYAEIDLLESRVAALEGYEPPPVTLTPTSPAETLEPTETPDPYLPWTYEACSDPDLSSGEDGFVWAVFVHTEDKVLRTASWPGGRDKDWPASGSNPLMEPPSTSSGERVRIFPGDQILVYRNPFQGQGDVYVELCSPFGQAIEWKWILFVGDSSTGRGPGDHGIE